MAFRLKRSDKSLAAALRRIARAQIDGALVAVGRPGENVRGIHEARARCKRLRGLIRLVRPAFATFDTENAAFRDAAKALESLRAGGAGLETLDRLAGAVPEGLDTDALAAIRAVFTAEALPHLATDRVADIATFRATLTDARARIAGWRLTAKGFTPARKGLEKTYAQGRRGLERAQSSSAPEAFHDWRKPVKYHWYHAQILRPIRPRRIDPQRDLAKALGEVLGDHHDLHDMRAHLTEGDFPPWTVAAMQAPVAAEMARIEAEALALGERLFVEEPKALARRWQSWWKGW
ncbi:CHAD domain-containing protein [Roseovarius autotrophicus]|uniref:CHAD domain-containing protein n=1 Tax=Roseovarius autotrophicus TaxID=2824121 RepID=UPI001A086F6C|nr:CHAD domain-containing protein [Roseovarius autotrophicus]MBE0452429.1 CHAD domain-containing protein [Roseovarius sp.]